MRLNLSDFQAMVSTDDDTDSRPVDLDAQEPNTIYYLKTTHRKMSNVTIQQPTP